MLVLDLDAGNGDVTCLAAECLEEDARHHPNRRVKPEGKVKCVPECAHRPI